MEDRSSYTTSSIPIVDSVPFFGEFAKERMMSTRLPSSLSF